MNADCYADVIGIASRAIGVDDIDVSKDIVSLGATSLAILQIVERIRESWGVDVPVIDVFEATDLDSFAKAVARQHLVGA